jgi:hypothetical protein
MNVDVSRASNLIVTDNTTADYITYYAANEFNATFDDNQTVSTINYEGLNLWW